MSDYIVLNSATGEVERKPITTAQQQSITDTQPFNPSAKANRDMAVEQKRILAVEALLEDAENSVLASPATKAKIAAWKTERARG